MARRFYGTRRERVCNEIFQGEAAAMATFAIHYQEHDPAHNNSSLPGPDGPQSFTAIVGRHQGRTTWWRQCLEAIDDNAQDLEIPAELHEQICHHLGRLYHPVA
jgi:hypothetical protein